MLGGGFPEGGFFGPWNVYVVGFLNPDDENQTLYGLGYGDGGFGTLYPGLWKFEADSDFPENIGNINYSISGNNLYMSANWNDILSDPDFGPWPNEFEILGLAGITIEASLDAFNFQDQTDAIVFNPSIQSFTIGQNTAPSLSDHGFEITGDSGGLYDVVFHCNFTDPDNHFPLVSEIIIDNEILDTMTSGDHDYADGSIFTVQASLAPGSHTYEMSFSDGMSDIGTGVISFTVGTEEMEYTIETLEGWNMVGLSVGIEDGGVDTIFPSAIDGTLFSFDGGYASETELIPGSGYWLRFDASGEVTISGQSINELTVPLSEGWNMIAGISSSVVVSSIGDPNGLIIPGTIYGFNDGYMTAETIEPGYGYWLRSSGDGEITLSESGNSRRVLNIERPEGANVLRVNGQTLYFGVEIPPHHDRLSYSLPPKPPAGAFDVRFEGDWKYVNEFGRIELMLNNKFVSMEYVINDDENWELLDSRNGTAYHLTGSGSILIPGDSKLFDLRKIDIFPNQFLLSQNFPNPFNPVTFITYTVPDLSYIYLFVYNLAGQEVHTLVSEMKAPGQYNVSWDGTDRLGNSVSSGIYFYELRGNEFLEMRKMIFMK